MLELPGGHGGGLASDEEGGEGMRCQRNSAVGEKTSSVGCSDQRAVARLLSAWFAVSVEPGYASNGMRCRIDFNVLFRLSATLLNSSGCEYPAFYFQIKVNCKSYSPAS